MQNLWLTHSPTVTYYLSCACYCMLLQFLYVDWYSQLYFSVRSISFALLLLLLFRFMSLTLFPSCSAQIKLNDELMIINKSVHSGDHMLCIWSSSNRLPQETLLIVNDTPTLPFLQVFHGLLFGWTL